MTKLLVPDGTGAFVPAKSLSVSNTSGVFLPAKNAWVAGADGRYTQAWPANTAVTSLTVAKGGVDQATTISSRPPWTSATLKWTVLNSTYVEVHLYGSAKVLYSGTAKTFTHHKLVPGQTYKYVLRCFGVGGAFVDSAPVSVTLDRLPAPANFKRSGGTSTGSYYTWDPVLDADGYGVVDTLTSGMPVKALSLVPTALETGQVASTVYERAVNAGCGNVKSALSAKTRYTTPAAPGSPPGGYTFPITGFDVWAPGFGGWRGSDNGIIHGNGDNWGGNNGDNATFFFYDLAAVRALTGRVTGFGVRLKRDIAAGYSAAQLSRWWLHTYSGGRPSGAPAYTQNATIDAGWLSWGTDLLIPLPVVWGQAMIDATFNTAGLVWGGVHPRYMRGPGPEDFVNQGCIYVILG